MIHFATYESHDVFLGKNHLFPKLRKKLKFLPIFYLDDFFFFFFFFFFLYILIKKKKAYFKFFIIKRERLKIMWKFKE